MKRNKPLLSLVILFSALRPVYVAHAQEMGEKQTLRGLQGVYLIIEDVKTGRFNTADGLTGNQLRQDLEEKLRGANIPVIKTQEEWLKSSGTPYLHVNVNYYKNSEGKYYVSMELVLEQEVVMARDPSIKLQTRTWGVKPDDFEVDNLQKVRKELGRLVDQFIEDYRDENPAK